ncbi:hypothetical protein L915_21315 [Phytophthora nicotianae]|uniref:Uncharacterized protein n=2 Tax=Phytophthora nicotianae TaxID=4792 RepID=V9DYE9_PHYNI|nr:hypothetical protein F443_21919 [Phytophthora nicotianae P1569]ETK71445.1 hypothetical protein L915_21315 [Phytophthora nicotianae]ETL24885.1 hypothetical protein L916_21186 [Phytophthora nicotianae]
MYKAGELVIAEMCTECTSNLHWSKVGREHVHYLDCEQGSKAACVYSRSATDQRVTEREFGAKPKKKTDEVLHEQF